MYLKLGEIATIISGYAFREALESKEQGNTYVLQAKNITHTNILLDISTLTRISFTSLRSNSYIQKDDILIVSRGMSTGTFRSTVYTGDYTNIIASSSVHIIRVTDTCILPEYLSLYINSFDGQKALFQSVSGSHFLTLLRKNLKELEIPVPTREKQEIIIALYKNIQQQEAILARKNFMRNTLYNRIFTNLVV